MNLLGQLRRLGAGASGLARRRLAPRLGRRPGPVAWFSLFDGGVVVALDPAARPGLDPEAVGITLRAAGRTRALAVARTSPLDDLVLALAPLDPDWLAGADACTVTVRAGGRGRSRAFALGPGRYAGRIDGVRDGALEGWVSPLHPEPHPRVELLVDGVAGAPARLDRYRRELMFSGGQGGWNGFRLLLPAHALDGRPHALAVRAGGTLLDHGVWTSEPRFNIEVCGPERLAGWYYDRGGSNVPSTLRLVRDGRTRAEVKTHARPDLKAAFGRDWASFAFDGADVVPGATLVAGPEGSGHVLGHLGADLAGRVAEGRARARRLLLAAGPASLPERRAVRERLAAERAGPEAGPAESFAFRPAGPGDAAGEGARPAETPSRAETPSPAKTSSPVGGVAPGDAPPGAIPPVCAVVPVYDGLSDLKLCLASLIPQLVPGRVRALVIDDGSPDPEVGRYLAGLAAARHPGLGIVANPKNLGFIGTVNRGLALLEPGEDALLVNADTILPPGAVERLARHCHARPGIASVTPMSNNATILSFPSLSSRNAPALGLDAAALDRAFAARAAAPVELPTGVGFCLHLNRGALDEVGPLDPAWGRGYCEEVDWCLTARDLGWIHLAAPDTFVMHEGSVSFTSATRLELLARNHARLEGLYPEYLAGLKAFAASDPFEAVRCDVLLDLIRGRFGTLTLHLTHGLGGGTKRYVDDLCALERGAGHEVALLVPVQDPDTDKRLELAFDRLGLRLTLTAAGAERVLAALEAAGVRVAIHVNSRLTYGSAFLETFLSGTRPYVVMLHDYQWYCPRVHLTDERRFYCGEPPPAVCQLCVTGGVGYDFGDQNAVIEADLPAFLRFNEGLLRGAARLLAPSRDTAERYARRFDLPGIEVVPHPEPRPRGVTRLRLRRAAPAGALRVAVVGAIGPHKGFLLLLRLVERAARARLPFFLTVIGYTPDDPGLVRWGNAEVTGSYAAGALPALLDRADPDLVLLPSVWPETYSYVLSEIWEAGYPVVAFDFGAPAERIREAGGGVLIEPGRDPDALLAALTAARADLAGVPNPVLAPTRVPTLEAYYGLDAGEGAEAPAPADAGAA